MLSDEMAYAGLLGRLIEVERILLVLADNRAERLPDVVPRRVVWPVVRVVVDSPGQLAVLLSRRDRLVWSGGQPVVVVAHLFHPSPTAGITVL